MGGRSKSSSTTNNTTQDFTFNNVDNRTGEGGGASNINFNLANSQIGHTTSSSSSSKYGVSTNADDGIGSGEGGGSAPLIKIEQSDSGAINAAKSIAMESLDSIGESNELAHKQTTQAINASLKTVAASANAGASSTLNTVGKYAVALAVVGGIVFYLKKRG